MRLVVRPRRCCYFWQPDPHRGRHRPGQALLGLTGLWYWGPRPYLLRLLAERALELSPPGGRGRASRFRAGPDGTWTGLDGYYRGETLRVGYGPGGRPDHLDLGTFVFTRQPYGPDGADVPLAARPDPDGWQTSDV